MDKKLGTGSYVLPGLESMLVIERSATSETAPRVVYPAAKRLRDPRLPAGTAEDVCDDHAAVALDERPDDGVKVSAAEAGARCGRCAEEVRARRSAETRLGETS